MTRRSQRIIESVSEKQAIPDYRRHRVPGGCYFFTVNLLERQGNDLLTRHIEVLRDAVRLVRRSRPFTIDACVVLPDHLHCVWTLPPDDDDFATRGRVLESVFARSLPLGERRSNARLRKGERGIWQRRFWEHTVRNDDDFAAHVDYVHFNPVKHGYVREPGGVAVFDVQGERPARAISGKLARASGTRYLV